MGSAWDVDDGGHRGALRLAGAIPSALPAFRRTAELLLEDDAGSAVRGERVGWIECLCNKPVRHIFFFIRAPTRLTMRLLLLLAEQSEQGGLRHAHHLETHSGNISHGMSRTTESSNQHLVVLIHVVQATIARNESGDLLAVLDQLHTHALTNGRVGLLSLHSSRDDL